MIAGPNVRLPLFLWALLSRRASRSPLRRSGTTTFRSSRSPSRSRSPTWRSLRRHSADAQLSLAVCISSLVLLSLASPARVKEPLDLWTTTQTSETADALVRARDAAFGSGASATYARFGGNGDPAHGAFIDDSLRLVCPRFHQYPWVPDLETVLSCVEERKPQLLLVTTTSPVER